MVNFDIQTKEMCPRDHHECWCGFVDEPRDFESYLRLKEMVLLKICSSEPEWLNNKDFFVKSEFSALTQIRLPNDTVLNRDQAEIYEKTLKNTSLDENENESTQIATSWRSLRLNTHYPRFCPPNFGWCWCGMIGDLKSYEKSIKSNKLIGEPELIIDCRAYYKRLYEHRNCSPASGDSLPWYDKLFFPLLKQFPCGYYEAS